MTPDSSRLIHTGQRKLGDRPRGRTAGFSMLEMLIVLIVVALLVAISIPKMARIMGHERVNRAAQVVVADLQNGFAMAGRQRAPVRLTFTPSTQTYVFTDRGSGTVLQTRVMNKQSEYSLTTLTSSPTTIDVLPNGIGSTSFTVTIAQGDYVRTVFASSAGFVRLVPL
ncbi:MAG TPA: prepilin-type N-terminal cleavage/methylation domain-containing protein [Gemmatimonadaceae bacterium]|nr:prepilin-type N-terminal cleavage/methylation domain-containing protein [Gemmatimonadaceae bacterium]